MILCYSVAFLLDLLNACTKCHALVNIMSVIVHYFCMNQELIKQIF
jgi:hypothetical protein